MECKANDQIHYSLFTVFYIQNNDVFEIKYSSGRSNSYELAKLKFLRTASTALKIILEFRYWFFFSSCKIDTFLPTASFMILIFISDEVFKLLIKLVISVLRACIRWDWEVNPDILRLRDYRLKVTPLHTTDERIILTVMVDHLDKIYFKEFWISFSNLS